MRIFSLVREKSKPSQFCNMGKKFEGKKEFLYICDFFLNFSCVDPSWGKQIYEEKNKTVILCDEPSKK